MRRATWVLCLTFIAAVAPTFAAGCSDTGDSSALPGDDAGSDSSFDLDARADGREQTDARKADDAGSDSSKDGGGDDSTSEEAASDASQDTSLDSPLAETGSDSSEDSPADSAEVGPDASSDSAPDAPADTGIDSPADSAPDSTADTGTDSAPDSGSDVGQTPCNGFGTGVEATPNTATGTCPATQINTGALQDGSGNYCCSKLLPCTTSTTNCVQCGGTLGAGGNGGLCTATEAQFVQHDIDTLVATAAGPDPDSEVVTQGPDSCYACLFEGGCLDDTMFGDTGHECEDVSSPFGGGTTTTECESVISCVLGSGNGASSCASAAVSGCYCGTAGVSSTCQGNPAAGPINGACAGQIAAGLDFSVSDGTDITKNLTDTSKGGGRAMQIFQCAQSNLCAACL